MKFLQVKLNTPYMFLLLETKSLPIETMAIERVIKYMLKVPNNPARSLLRITQEASKSIHTI